MRTIISIAALSMALMTFTSAQAVPLVEIYNPATSGIGSINITFDSITDPYIITIDENWTSENPGYLEINGLVLGRTYTVNKVIHNNTGVAWTSLANELLDPDSGPSSEDRRDKPPYPSFVPSGFTTSNDFDGLSFAQSSYILRTSNVFNNLTVDETSDARDFLDFYNGTLPAGGVGTISYGLFLNTIPNTNNQPFLLSQRPNTFSKPTDPPQVPEPASLALLGIGLGGLMLQGYRRRNS